jgi:predicted RNase H-like HicB family nuclease
MLKIAGWFEIRTSGSHQQFRHPVKSGVVTVPLHGSRDSQDRHPDLDRAAKRPVAEAEMTVARCYFPAVVIQDLADGPGDGFDVVIPDFPGCVSSGESADDAARAAATALSLHIQAMLAAGETVPAASARGGIPAWLKHEPVKVVRHIVLPVDVPELAERH